MVSRLRTEHIQGTLYGLPLCRQCRFHGRMIVPAQMFPRHMTQPQPLRTLSFRVTAINEDIEYTHRSC